MALPSAPGLVFAAGLGGAAATAFEPKFEVPKQQAWLANPQRLPDVGLIAALYAGGKIDLTSAQNMANRLGYSDGTLDSLTWLAQNRLDFPLMLRMWRLASLAADLPNTFGTFGDIDTKGYIDETLAHEQLDWNYQPYLRALQTAELPGIGDVAFAVVRGILPSPSYVPVAPGTGGQYVKPFPQLDIPAEDLAAALGYSPEMLELLVGRSGLSMAPVMAANAYFRTSGRLALANLLSAAQATDFDLTPVMDADDYLLAIGQGDLRTNYADAVKSTAREILTAGQYAELELRGFISPDERRAFTQQHGMSKGDSDLLYDVLGRAPAVHAVTTGVARGGAYNGDTTGIPERYLSAMQRSNARPEWYSIDYANRYSYPSAFVLRTMAQSGEITPGEADGILLSIGWPPWLAAKVTESWTGAALHDPATIPETYADAIGAWTAPAGGSATPNAKKAATQLWSTTHTAYKNGEIGKTDATTNLTALGISAAEQADVFTYWDAERLTIRKQLSVAQLQKAEKDGLTNPATKLPFTSADVIAALVDRGYDQDDAQTLAAGA